MRFFRRLSFLSSEARQAAKKRARLRPKTKKCKEKGKIDKKLEKKLKIDENFYLKRLKYPKKYDTI